MWKLGHREVEWPALSHTARPYLRWCDKCVEVSNICSGLQYLHMPLRLTCEKIKLIGIYYNINSLRIFGLTLLSMSLIFTWNYSYFKGDK